MTRVLVAMSGGVDSAVSAALLKRQGYEVTGVTLKLWGGAQDQGCCSVSDVDDARRVAQQLEIDHFVFNYGEAFERHVVGPYVEAHASGLTPNPCIECNRHIKFDALLDRARQLNFDRVATGHHAQIVATENGPRLSRGADLDKDQSYVLYMLSERDLNMLEFPIGHMKKTEVRELANELGLRSASKPDSQDVCFITASEGRGRFLSERLNLHAGQVVDMGGNNIGTVDAVELVTVGQRKGLKLGGNVGRSYAVEVDIPSRRVIAGSAQDLLSETVELRDHFWIGPEYQGSVAVQTSAHGDPAAAHLNADGSVQWAQARRKVAPGQAVVFYLDDAVIGGAIAC
tara:strand:- start:479 stop:1507 length:1029 start_codon:yes stop_codon:yes gene_type:complete